MAEYIERSAAVKIAEKYGLTNGSALGLHSGVADCIESEILTVPAADVALVRYGRWIEEADGSHFCSECARDARWKVDDISGTNVSFVEELSNYCPSCGAIMVEEVSEWD